MKVDDLYSYKQVVSAFKQNISHELRNYSKNKNILMNSILFNCDNPCDNDMDIHKYGVKVSVNIDTYLRIFTFKASYYELFNFPSFSPIIKRCKKEIDDYINPIEKIKKQFHISNDFLKNKTKAENDDFIEAVQYDLNQLNHFCNTYEIVRKIYKKVIEDRGLEIINISITNDNPLYYKDPSIYVEIEFMNNETFTYKTSFAKAIHTGQFKLESELIYNLDKFLYPDEIKRLEEYHQEEN